jgi:hypothetical protein
MSHWFRSWHGAPTDNKWLVVARRAGVAPGIVSAVVWALLDYASQNEDRGNVAGFDIETYAAFSGFDEADVERVIEAIRDKLTDSDGNLWAWDRRQPKREDDSSSRVRAFRERTKRDVTQCNAPEEIREDTESKEASASLVDADERATLPHIPGRSENFIADVEAVEAKLARMAAPQPDVPLPTGPVVLVVPPQGPDPPSRRKGAMAHELPDTWEPSETVIKTALEQGYVNDRFRNELAAFRDHARANRRKCFDWNAAASNWFRQAFKFEQRSGASSARGVRREDDSRIAASHRALARLRNSPLAAE